MKIFYILFIIAITILLSACTFIDVPFVPGI